VYQTQLAEVLALASAFPDVSIVLDHLGGRLGDAQDERWRADLHALSRLPNVYLKLGGLGMKPAGYRFHEAPLPPTSAALARAWRPSIMACIETFGPERCMFESNFPVDKLTCDYRTLWNAFKRIAGSCSEDEKTALFSGTARRAYRLSAS
jgi:predicted TIM-barrel fold metal-dependent hydrolase